MSKASEEALASLHGALAEAFKKKLESGDYTASDLSVIRQFLKDNGINADGERDPGIQSIADELPDLPDDNVTPLYGR